MAQIPRCCGCGIRRLAAAALIRLLAWELAYAVGAALKRPKKKKKYNLWMLLCYNDKLNSCSRDGRLAKAKILTLGSFQGNLLTLMWIESH